MRKTKEEIVRRKRNVRGFTLVELMMVVVIIGVLAALSTYGVRRYAQSSKTAEALQNVGAIGRAVGVVATRESMSGTANLTGADLVSSNIFEAKGWLDVRCDRLTTMPDRWACMDGRPVGRGD